MWFSLFITTTIAAIMLIMDWSLLILLILAPVGRGEDMICLTGDQEPYFLFGTKTAYEYANQGIPTNKLHEVPGCQPLAIWLLNREGSSNPQADEITDLQQLVNLKANIVTNYRNGNIRNNNQRICAVDFDQLERWQWSPQLNQTFAGDLTSEGYLMTEQLAQTWKNKFPGLLTGNRHDYLFKFPSDKHSRVSFQAFTEGLFGANLPSTDAGYGITKENDDKLLRPYKLCPKWTKEVEENNSTWAQVDMFKSSWQYKEMVRNISQRLGFNYAVDEATVHRMYQMCRYTKARQISQMSPWCAVFSKEDLKRLEYAEDLETYYKYGYGSQLNQRIGCALLNEMIGFFNNHIVSELPQQPLSLIHFTEAPTLLMVLTSLGAHRDPAPLAADTSRAGPAQARRWTTSTMTPYSANLAAVLFKCQKTNFQNREKYQVLFLENGQQMYLEGCRVGLCDWSYIRDRLWQPADKCQAECNTASSIKGLYSVILASLLIFLTKSTLL